MATHSSILAWRIPWTEEPGGLKSTGSQRVRYNLATKHPPPLPSFIQFAKLCILAPAPLREALLSRLPWHEATQPNVFLKTCDLPFLEIKKRELLVKGSEFSGLTVQMHA